MRNVWKGLVVGGLTGVAAGVVLDSLAGASRKAVVLGDQVREHAPEAGRWVQTVGTKAGEWLHDADVPDHVRSVGQRIKDSDTAHHVGDMTSDIVEAARNATSAHTG